MASVQRLGKYLDDPYSSRTVTLAVPLLFG